MAAPRRRKGIGHRRRVEDEGDDEAGLDAMDVDDDSLTDGSIATDDHDAGDDSDTSNIDETSPTSPNNVKKSANGVPKSSLPQNSSPDDANTKDKLMSDTDAMLHGLSISDQTPPTQEMHFDELVAPSPPKSPNAPVVVSSASATRQQPTGVRRRQEHEDYKRRRDEDPAFVPNRGAFFMHDHRHPGPSANGFRPFGRGRGRGGRGGAIGGPFAPIRSATNTHPSVIPATLLTVDSQMQHPSADPTTSSPWTHDMHDAVVEQAPRRPRHMAHGQGPANSTGFIPTREPNSSPINRTMSTEKHIGKVQVRVSLPGIKTSVFPGVPVKQYTKLPDHRPPLRRDKPVRISLPNNSSRLIFPAVDRSFIFIPRAMRPNQQRVRGKPRSGLGSAGGFSRRTSVFGGSYYGSVYSPSIALSRRSSLAPEHDYMFSPTGSVSRLPMGPEASRPVVRLPPSHGDGLLDQGGSQAILGQPGAAPETPIDQMPPPQTHPLPQKPAFQENRPNSLPMHQPRPQKNISLADIESPTFSQGPPAFQQAFHHQVPLHMSNGYPSDHSRQPSHPQHSTGTPLQQIPERAIHAAPFQPNTYGQPPYYGPPYQIQPQQGYYYPPGYPGPSAMNPQGPMPGFIPGQSDMSAGFPPQSRPEPSSSQANGAPDSNANLVAQEHNGMVYYYNPAQVAPVQSYPPYAAGPQGYQPSVVGMGGMVTPSPDGFYYPQPGPGPGPVFYPQ